MLISSLLIENYRSITKAELPLHNYSVLIGPNNQGKSNILRGLAVAMSRIETYFYDSFLGKSKRLSLIRSLPRFRYGELSKYTYDYRRDYPLKLQSKDVNKEGKTKLALTISFSDKEKIKFNKETKNAVKGYLSIALSLGYRKEHIEIEDTSNPKKQIKNLGNILEFILENIEITYIEAIRDSKKTLEIVDQMISDDLSILNSKKKYTALMSKVESMQKPILDALSKSLTKSVSGFLPDVKKIHLDSRERIRRITRLATTLYVDDGNNTSLDLKGDGIKSLLAISIIQHVTQKRAHTKKIMLAIEEPESHLHPEAIHKLRSVLEDISTRNQVIISTHSPLLAHRTDLTRNLVVDQSQATAARSISEIRDVLGVRIADNLTSASLVILTEGNDDAQKLKKWASELSPAFKDAVSDGVIIFNALEGSSNLAYKSYTWKNMLCDVYAFLDDDKAGRKAFEDADKRESISIENVTFSHLNSYQESELEDLILPSFYSKHILKMGVDISKTKIFKNSKNKWSIRMKNTFKDQGKPWNNSIEATVKNIVTDVVKEHGIKCVHKKNQKPLRKFVKDIEEYIKKRSETQKQLQEWSK